MIDLDTLCTQAEKRLRTGVAISAGRHLGMIRRQFQAARVRLIPPEPAYGFGFHEIPVDNRENP